MPTVREQKLADVIIENAASDKGMTAKEMLVKAGYDETTAKATPGRVIAQDGVQEALTERGFSLESAKSVIAKITHSETAKDRDKLTGADMMLKVVGGYAPEKKIVQSVSVEGTPQDYVEAKALAERYEQEYLQGLKTE